MGVGFFISNYFYYVKSAMKIANIILSVMVLGLLVGSPVHAEPNKVVIEEDGVKLTQAELTYLVSRWTNQMRDVAIKDEGDRLELLNLMLANKKVALEAENLVERQPELEQAYRNELEAYQRDFVLRQHRDAIEYPDFTELAKEQYTLHKDKYALIPETRISSHILFSSPPGNPRDDIIEEASVILEELRAGADFNAMVAEHSDEPRAAERNGKFDRWLKFGEIGVSPPYTEGLFQIEDVGDYSELVQTEFGVHIIRLDGIKEKSYRPFEDVQAAIIDEMKAEYTRLEMKDFVTRFNMGEDVFIDMEAVKDILAPYAKSGASQTGD